MDLFFDATGLAPARCAAAGFALVLLFAFAYAARATIRASLGRAAPLLVALTLGALSLGTALAALFAVPAAVGAGPGVLPGYAPKTSGLNLPQYATPAALAAVNVAYLTTGSLAEVPRLGQFAYQPSCPTSCDGCPVNADAGGCTCVPANGGDGGSGCWIRGPVSPCLCTVFAIDPVNGSDLAANCGTLQSGAEYSRRTAGCSIQQGQTLSILGPLPPTDYLALPNIGPPVGSTAGTTAAAARLTLDCRSGNTKFYISDGGLADASAQAGNNPIYIVDTGVNFLDAGGVNLVGYRFHDTGNLDGGAHDGGIGWIMGADGGTAILSQPLYEVVEDGGTGSTVLVPMTPSPGDTYYVDIPPLIPAISFPATINTAPYTQNGNLVVVGCSFGNAYGPSTISTPVPDGGYIYSYQHVPNYGGPHDFYADSSVHFETSAMGGLGGNLWCEGCSWEDGFPTVASGDNTTILASALFGDVWIGSGGNAIIGEGTVCIGGNASCIFDRGSVLVTGQFTGGLGVLNVVTGGFAGIYVEPGGVLNNQQTLWGSGTSGAGVKVRGGELVWATLPTLTGTSDLVVGNVTQVWSTISLTGVTVGTSFAYPYATTPSIIPAPRALMWGAQVSATATGTQLLPPGSGAATLTSDTTLGWLAPSAGTLSAWYLQYAGSALNIAGQTITCTMTKINAGGSTTMATIPTLVTTTGVQRASTTTFAVASYAAGDDITVTCATSAILTAALTDLLAGAQ